MPLIAKLAIPLAMATVGTGAAIAAVATHEPAATQVSTAAQVWIDAPTSDVAVAPGRVHVGAHATAIGSITSLDLYVDGKKVATDTTLDRNAKLVYGSFDWDAAVGDHELVVAQPSSDRRSLPVLVLVTDDPAATTTSTSATSSTTTTTAPGETTTTTGPADTTTTTPGTVTVPGTSTPGVTVVPPTAPPTTTTTPPAARPVIDGSGLSGTLVYRVACGYPDVQVTARVRNATTVTMRVDESAYARTMARSGSSSYSATIVSGVWGPGEVGQHQVIVEARGPGGSVDAVAGTVEIRMNCPKD